MAIVAAVIVMVSVILLLGPAFLAGPEDGAPPPLAPPVPAERPIPEEADVFRTAPSDLAPGAETERRPGAMPRTLEVYRRLRAFPGAPPRIPHGLTEEEARHGLCNACHARGGYVPRFGGYAPVTPHPEYADCLQCHVANAMTLGIGFPEPRRDAICTQCHVDPDRPPPTFVALDWPDPSWPELDRRALPESPPLIPHDLQMRGNCVACHAGPGAVRELRTAHPERADCRQCHLPATDRQGVFRRTVRDVGQESLDPGQGAEGGR